MKKNKQLKISLKIQLLIDHLNVKKKLERNIAINSKLFIKNILNKLKNIANECLVKEIQHLVENG